MHMHGYWIFGLLFLHFINYLHPCIGITANILIKVGPVMDPTGVIQSQYGLLLDYFLWSFLGRVSGPITYCFSYLSPLPKLLNTVKVWDSNAETQKHTKEWHILSFS